jgi:hypothetical protein
MVKAALRALDDPHKTNVREAARRLGVEGRHPPYKILSLDVRHAPAPLDSGAGAKDSVTQHAASMPFFSFFVWNFALWPFFSFSDTWRAAALVVAASTVSRWRSQKARKKAKATATDKQVSAFLGKFRREVRKGAGQVTVSMRDAHRRWAATEGGQPVSLRTIQRGMVARGWKCVRPKTRTILSKTDKEARVEWCEKNKGRRAAFWKNTMIIDNSRVQYILSKSHRVRVLGASVRHCWTWPGGPRAVKPKKGNRVNTGGSVSFCVGTFRGRLFYVRCATKWNGAEALQLYKKLHKMACAEFGLPARAKIRLLEDNDRCYKAKAIRAAKSKMFTCYEMPVRSPDIMPLDRVGFKAVKEELGARLVKKPGKLTKKQFENVLKKSVDAIASKLAQGVEKTSHILRQIVADAGEIVA